MKVKVNNKLTEIDVAFLRIDVPVRYEEEGIPKDFPLRVPVDQLNQHSDYDRWQALVDVETGKLSEWPVGKTGRIHMKVCDEGNYTLYDANMNELADIEEDYVPSFLPGEHCGDYIIFDIGEDGVIANWPTRISSTEINEFFKEAK